MGVAVSRHPILSNPTPHLRVMLRRLGDEDPDDTMVFALLNAPAIISHHLIRLAEAIDLERAQMREDNQSLRKALERAESFMSSEAMMPWSEGGMSTTRERVRHILHLDPLGELSDLAIAADLGVSEPTVKYHRDRLGIPTAQSRRRKAPDARVAHCAPCSKEYLLQKDRRTTLCTGCGEWVGMRDATR